MSVGKLKELCDIAGIKKTRTTPYHPRGNPVEQFNRTLMSMLGTLEPEQKERWKKYVKPLVHAYNCTKNEVTGYTPYERMFGRSPRLPVDLAFGLPVRDAASNSHSQYVQNLRSRLEESYQLASKNVMYGCVASTSWRTSGKRTSTLSSAALVIFLCTQSNQKIIHLHKVEPSTEIFYYHVDFYLRVRNRNCHELQLSPDPKLEV